MQIKNKILLIFIIFILFFLISYNKSFATFDEGTNYFIYDEYIVDVPDDIVSKKNIYIWKSSTDVFYLGTLVDDSVHFVYNNSGSIYSLFTSSYSSYINYTLKDNTSFSKTINIDGVNYTYYNQDCFSRSSGGVSKLICEDGFAIFLSNLSDCSSYSLLGFQNFFR